MTERFSAEIAAKGLTVMHRIEHSAAAQQAGVEIRPTTLLIFGKPSLGAKLMQKAPTAALDLPMKLLIHQDSDGYGQVLYNRPAFLWHRHRIEGDKALRKQIGRSLRGLVDAVCGAEAPAHAASRP